MEKKYTIPQKHAQHINWNSIMPTMLNIWRRVRATETEDGDILVEVIEESHIPVIRKPFAFIESHPLTDGSLVHAVAVYAPNPDAPLGRKVVGYIDCITEAQAVALCNLINETSDVRIP